MSAQFRKHLQVDSWIVAASSAFPDHRFDLLTGTPVPDGVVGPGEVVGDAPEDAADTIRAHPDIADYDELYADEQRTLTRFKWTDNEFFNYLREVSVAPEFPVVVSDGVMGFDVTVTREQFEAVGAALDATDQPDESAKRWLWVYGHVSILLATALSGYAVARERYLLALLLVPFPLVYLYTAGCNKLKEFATPGWRISLRTYSRQYVQALREGKTYKVQSDTPV